MNGVYSFKIILLLTLLINLLFSNDKPTITWLINDVAPFYIKNEPFKNEGIGDLTQKIIIEKMNKYNHIIKETTLKRAMKDFEYGKEVCFSTWIYNSTPDLTITSIPNLYYPPLGIITTKENKEKLGKTVSLKNLMVSSGLTFVQAKGRGYGNPLDKIIEENKTTENFIIRDSSDDTTNGVFEMINRKRADYTVDYISSLNYYRLLQKDETNLVFIPLEENYEEGTLGAIACSKTAWGQKVIEDINSVIKELRVNEEYKNISQNWLVPKNETERYWNIYNNKVVNFK